MSGARAWNRPDRAPALQENHSFSVVLLTERAIHVPHLSCLSLRNLRARCAPERPARTRAARAQFVSQHLIGEGTARLDPGCRKRSRMARVWSDSAMASLPI